MTYAKVVGKEPCSAHHKVRSSQTKVVPCGGSWLHIMSMSYQNKHSSNPPVENLNLPKVKLIKSYKANSHLTMENMNLPKVKLIPSYIANSISPWKT